MVISGRIIQSLSEFQNHLYIPILEEKSILEFEYRCHIETARTGCPPERHPSPKIRAAMTGRIIRSYFFKRPRGWKAKGWKAGRRIRPVERAEGEGMGKRIVRDPAQIRRKLPSGSEPPSLAPPTGETRNRLPVIRSWDSVR
ncbi:Hypothetical protein NTJ_15576 [Nesidiocoris tenuis]|uniref:Uncharacterized protein n=1 Tax=Nesidiocoris tenuis TaxID=355587 RepID=A0ABN7BHY9_9HEMI|nr:Hypothetical protein NTJ_15576 [Nesidiocoris tenuis]